MSTCSNCGMGFYHPEDYSDHLPCESVVQRLTRERDEARASERAAVVAWLRSDSAGVYGDASRFDVAEAIERGEHRK